MHNIKKYNLYMVKEANFKYDLSRLKTPEDVYELAKEYLKNVDREHFVTIALDTRSNIIGINTVSIGSIDTAVVHPREVFKFAILANAVSVIFVHNHPSGDPQASHDDIQLTQRLVEAGNVLGIDIIDSIIIGDGTYVSLRREGLLNNGKKDY
jgi:DNA repair protein RadC